MILRQKMLEVVCAEQTGFIGRKYAPGILSQKLINSLNLYNLKAWNYGSIDKRFPFLLLHLNIWQKKKGELEKTWNKKQ